MTMQDARRTLGERIIEAARLAMLAHLECSSAAEHAEAHASDARQRQTPAADGVGIATPRDGNVRDVRAFPTDGEPVLPTGLHYLAEQAMKHAEGRAG
jgi:hypothetical protein